MASASGISVSQVHSTFGCLFLSVVFTSVLWGIGCLQLFLYYEKYWKTDKDWLKVYLLVIWILDTAHQIMLLHADYLLLVRSLADAAYLSHLPKSGTSTAIVTTIIDALVQAMFVWRSWHLSNRNLMLAGILSTAVLGQFVVNLWYFSQIIILTELSQLSTVVHVDLALNSTMAFTDTLLAVALMWLLWRSHSGMKRTAPILNRLITYTVGTGLVTSLCTITGLIGAIVLPNALIYLLMNLILPKLYFNCLLASLNARSHLRGALSNDAGGLSIHLDNYPSASNGSSNVISRSFNKVSSSRVIECRVDIDIEPESDPHSKPTSKASLSDNGSAGMHCLRA
ncbi:hypothetical protein A7U60_g1847 [Sanghuangporus baumii]|uniref:DUF6534 domain-containing protein n=1 Tax=Sanghuangporus baumii TaxID=108892 RepID=A0A9Q5I3M0_SANBA|nr:hypothetical protein A7U60_g1847 [Sanghuangporus baumii]